MYKRLTNNNLEEYNPELDFCADCKYYGEPNGCNRPNGTCGNYERFIETYNRLAELEDKIDNGTLIDLPFIQKGKYGNRWYVYYRKNHGNQNITWKMYYSKAEAEKKLKGLQSNERK